MQRRIFTSLAAASAVTAAILITGAVPAAAAPAPAPALADSNTAARSAVVTPNEKLPEAIQVKPAENLAVVATLLGVGKQVYDCDPATHTYPAKSREPEAGLFTLRGVPAGIHGKQPFWANLDGSHVDGSDAVSPPAPPAAPAYTDLTKNVPWLRLKGTPTPNTTGVFSKVTVIQRIDTRGGVAPTGTCTDPSTKAVDYTANYVFWAPK